MATKRSQKSSYESRFGGGYFSPEKWLAESMCDRQAQRDGKELGLKFWRLTQWTKVFRREAVLAQKLLNEFSAAAVSRALWSKEGLRVYTLGAPWLKDLAEKAQRTIDAEKKALAEKPPAPPPPSTTEQPRPAFVPKNSAIAKLRGL